MKKLLEIKDLSVRYRVSGGMLSAVNKVNLDINQGEIFAVIGESGCGKSTMAFALMRLLMNGTEEITGSVMYNGTDLLKLSEREMEAVRGKEIGMIFQNPLDSLNPVYRSGTQITEGRAKRHSASFIRLFITASASELSSPFMITCPMLTAGRVRTDAFTGVSTRRKVSSRKKITSGA